MPARHDIRPADVSSGRLGAALALAYDSDLHDFVDAVLVPGVGQRTLLSLALVAEVIHGAPHRFADPARFALAHGGKDGHPFPVPTRVYDETIHYLRDALERARVGREDRLQGLGALSRLEEVVERVGHPEADLDALVRREWRDSPALGGRTVGRLAGGKSPKAAPSEHWVQGELL
jgi:hypothetical protein